jgi:hypothetical protein
MSAGPTTTESPPPSGPRHEPEGSSSRGILLGALIFLVSLALILVCVRALLHQFWRANPSRMPGNVPSQVTSSPVAAWVNPVRDLAELRAREDEHLTTYGWLDRERGVVRIPIEEAMQRLLERGTPAVPTQPGSTPP